MSKGRFGVHGGQYMPETLMNAVIELEQAYERYQNDPTFQAELTGLDVYKRQKKACVGPRRRLPPYWRRRYRDA